jgi:hypothetical protein
MRAKSALLLIFASAVGCAGQAGSPQPRFTPPKAAAPVGGTATAAEPEPAETLAQADQAYDSQLGAVRGGQFDVERQVTVLRRAVLLYTQFLERAEGRPELLPAVRKSHERIDDANATIDFLLASLRDGGEPPPAKTEPAR